MDNTPVFGPESALGLLIDITQAIAKAVRDTPPGHVVVCPLITGGHDVEALKWVIEEIARQHYIDD